MLGTDLASRVAVTGGRHRCSAPRTIHVLDIENLVAGAVNPATVAGLWREYTRRVVVRRDDQVVAAVADRNAVVAWFNLPLAGVTRVIAGSGPDAADRALSDAIDVEHAARRFERMLIGSCDHHFTDLARRAVDSGMRVGLVTPLEFMPARELYLVVHTHVSLDGGTYLNPMG